MAGAWMVSVLVMKKSFFSNSIEWTKSLKIYLRSLKRLSPILPSEWEKEWLALLASISSRGLKLSKTIIYIAIMWLVLLVKVLPDFSLDVDLRSPRSCLPLKLLAIPWGSSFKRQTSQEIILKILEMEELSGPKRSGWSTPKLNNCLISLIPPTQSKP